MTRARTPLARQRRAAGSLCLLAPLALAAALLADPEPARAFSDRTYFDLPTGRGGGGGRFFTGSPVDGFACSVCHRGGEEPQVQVTGLPVDGYQPGRPYDIEIAFLQPMKRYSLQLELIGRDGRVPGEVKLIDPNTVDAQGRCGKKADGDVAAYEQMVGARKVIGVQDCFAANLRFRFTPPNVPDLAFSASIVTSSNTGTVEGDGVLNLRRVLRRQGEPAQTGDCSLAAGRGSPSIGGGLPWLAALALVLWRKRRR